MAINQLPTFMAAIRALESGSGDPKGNYKARGPVVGSGRYAGERAMGAYQIMPGNWPSWAAAAGIPGANWRDPAAQDRVARDQFRRLYQKYGRWDAVAVAWFAGQSRADKFVQGADLSHVNDATQGHSGTSVPSYVQTIQRYMSEFDPEYNAEADAEVARLRQQARNQTGEEGVGGGVQGTPEQLDAYNPNPDIVGLVEDEDEAERKAATPAPTTMLAGVLDSISRRAAGGERIPVWELGSLDREAPSQPNDEGEDDTGNEQEVI